MRTPEDIAFPYNRIIYERQTGDEVTISAAIDILDVYDIVRQAQEEPLKAAAEHAKVKHVCYPDNFPPGGYYVVDRDSILKLMK